MLGEQGAEQMNQKAQTVLNLFIEGYNTRLSLSDIARQCNCSREYVRQVVEKNIDPQEYEAIKKYKQELSVATSEANKLSNHNTNFKIINHNTVTSEGLVFHRVFVNKVDTNKFYNTTFSKTLKISPNKKWVVIASIKEVFSYTADNGYMQVNLSRFKELENDCYRVTSGTKRGVNKCKC